LGRHAHLRHRNYAKRRAVSNRLPLSPEALAGISGWRAQLASVSCHSSDQRLWCGARYLDSVVVCIAAAWQARCPTSTWLLGDDKYLPVSTPSPISLPMQCSSPTTSISLVTDRRPHCRHARILRRGRLLERHVCGFAPHAADLRGNGTAACYIGDAGTLLGTLGRAYWHTRSVAHLCLFLYTSDQPLPANYIPTPFAETIPTYALPDICRVGRGRAKQ